ncbi:bromodomain-containing protein 8-like [Cotesia glomerata]|uniref:Bromo domain-containing protein n=1 Tax=Cotesia glomerata TaxID=32391 RepID=A0AAV7IVJ1_COTGL|nr:bromodomain-containing protein 8-like [Cotesia glomerata]KAH0558078.1 hypothetical protein KQX54_014263 [Cotesia glomerata]
MTSVQERLKTKQRESRDTWSTREQLCLASSVLKSGDQNWITVSRSLKPFAEKEALRPPDWFSHKACANQYTRLLENVDMPKRKKRESGETIGESIVKRLTQERTAELGQILAFQRDEYQQLKSEVNLLKSGSISDDKLQKMWQAIEQEEREQEQKAKAHSVWLAKRQQKQDLTSQSPTPLTPLKKTLDLNDTPEDSNDEEEKKRGSSTLLTNLLKAPSPTKQIQNATSTAQVTSPTIASLLNSSGNVHMVSSAPQNVTAPIHHIVTSVIPSGTPERPSAGAPTLSMLLALPANLPKGSLPTLPAAKNDPETSVRSSGTKSSNQAPTIQLSSTEAEIVNSDNVGEIIEQIDDVIGKDKLPDVIDKDEINEIMEDIEELIKEEITKSPQTENTAVVSRGETFPGVEKNEEVEAKVEKTISLTDSPESEMAIEEIDHSSSNIAEIIGTAIESNKVVEEKEEKEKVEEEEVEDKIEEEVKKKVEGEGGKVGEEEEKMEVEEAGVEEEKVEKEEKEEVGKLEVKEEGEEVKEEEKEEKNKVDEVEDKKEDKEEEDKKEKEEVEEICEKKEEVGMDDKEEGKEEIKEAEKESKELKEEIGEEVKEDDKEVKEEKKELVKEEKECSKEEIVVEEVNKEEKEVEGEKNEEVVKEEISEAEKEEEKVEEKEEKEEKKVEGVEEVKEDEKEVEKEEEKEEDVKIEKKEEEKEEKEKDEKEEGEKIEDLEVEDKDEVKDENEEVKEEEAEESVEEVKEEKEEQVKEQKQDKEEVVENKEEEEEKEKVEKIEEKVETKEAEEVVEVKKEESVTLPENTEVEEESSLIKLSGGRAMKTYSKKQNVAIDRDSEGDNIGEEADYRNWKKAVLLVYQRFTQHKYASLFSKPITEEQAPGYHSVIFRPMDLLTIKKNIENGTIRSTMHFQRDVMLMFQNALMYNKQTNHIHKMAMEMQEDCLQEFQMLVGVTKDVSFRRETRTAGSSNSEFNEINILKRKRSHITPSPHDSESPRLKKRRKSEND